MTDQSSQLYTQHLRCEEAVVKLKLQLKLKLILKLQFFLKKRNIYCIEDRILAARLSLRDGCLHVYVNMNA